MPKFFYIVCLFIFNSSLFASYDSLEWNFDRHGIQDEVTIHGQFKLRFKLSNGVFTANLDLIYYKKWVERGGLEDEFPEESNRFVISVANQELWKTEHFLYCKIYKGDTLTFKCDLNLGQSHTYDKLYRIIHQNLDEFFAEIEVLNFDFYERKWKLYSKIVIPEEKLSFLKDHYGYLRFSKLYSTSLEYNKAGDLEYQTYGTMDRHDYFHVLVPANEVLLQKLRRCIATHVPFYMLMKYWWKDRKSSISILPEEIFKRIFFSVLCIKEFS